MEEKTGFQGGKTVYATKDMQEALLSLFAGRDEEDRSSQDGKIRVRRNVCVLGRLVNLGQRNGLRDNFAGMGKRRQTSKGETV